MSVRIVKRGMFCQILAPPLELIEPLKQELTYTKRASRVEEFIDRNGRERTRRVPYEEHRCNCQYLLDPQRQLLPRLVFPSGYLLRAAHLLRRMGIKFDVLQVPFLAMEPASDVSWSVYENHWKSVTHQERDFSWRWRQVEALDIMDRTPGGLIIAPTGWGKGTVIARYCLRHPNLRIDITTHSVSVVETLYRRLQREGVRNVGLYSGTTTRSGRVNCVSGKSVHRVKRDADVVIVDEVHEWGTDDYLNRLAKVYPFARKFGFSANCGDRLDNTDFELEGAFGPVLFSMSYQEAVANGCCVPIQTLWHIVDGPNPIARLKADSAKKKHGLWKHGRRNAEIAEVARTYPPETQVLIVVETIEHVINLKALLPEFEAVYAADGLSDEDRAEYCKAGLIPWDFPRMTEPRRQMLTRMFSSGKLKKAIVNSVWNRGVDFPELSVLIRADAQNSPIPDTQIPGRAARIDCASGKQQSTIHDFIDMWDPEGFEKRSWSRMTRYRSKGWPQILAKTGQILRGPASLASYRAGQGSFNFGGGP